MMTAKDVIKQTFLDSLSNPGVSTTQMAVSMILTTLIALYLFVVYRVFTRKTFYSKSFNIALVAITIITASIIIAMQSSFVISLGMVGALSIIRFRTAIKDPMDLVYLFWSVSVGIICGADLFELAVGTSLLLTGVILVLNYMPVAKAPMLLLVNAESCTAEEEIMKIAAQYSKIIKVKSRTVTNGKLAMIVEVNVRKEAQLLEELAKLSAVETSSLISHDGEVTV